MARPGMSDGGYGSSYGRGGGSGGARGGSDARGGGKMAVEDPRGSRNGTGFGRRKVCRYCADKTAKVDFKDAGALKYFLTERGKIIPRRISGNCATHQREVARAIKRSRQIALLPYTVING